MVHSMGRSTRSLLLGRGSTTGRWCGMSEMVDVKNLLVAEKLDDKWYTTAQSIQHSTYRGASGGV